ncbi:uncharacterized protein G2W53_010457 [Senna tora]|uniref:Uncharacterized protein n=1 Tax=Senna tora TaxID=362788 RepID=A0A834WZU9_9FABA|nr:uncharacterized protein G2W53_010457 [Senna tora]
MKSVAEKGFLYAVYAFSLIVFSSHVPELQDDISHVNVTVAMNYFITVRNENATKNCRDRFRRLLALLWQNSATFFCGRIYSVGIGKFFTDKDDDSHVNVTVALNYFITVRNETLQRIAEITLDDC